MATAQGDRGIPALISVSVFGMSAEIRTANPLIKFLEYYLCANLFVLVIVCMHAYISSTDKICTRCTRCEFL